MVTSNSVPKFKVDPAPGESCGSYDNKNTNRKELLSLLRLRFLNGLYLCLLVDWTLEELCSRS
ncbi:unnamed protein product [Tenebrio molitor]|nr:unnamed protein product [Tenebrio molitor]